MDPDFSIWMQVDKKSSILGFIGNKWEDFSMHRMHFTSISYKFMFQRKKNVLYERKKTLPQNRNFILFAKNLFYWLKTTFANSMLKAEGKKYKMIGM